MSRDIRGLPRRCRRGPGFVGLTYGSAPLRTFRPGRAQPGCAGRPPAAPAWRRRPFRQGSREPSRSDRRGAKAFGSRRVSGSSSYAGPTRRGFRAWTGSCARPVLGADRGRGRPQTPPGQPAESPRAWRCPWPGRSAVGGPRGPDRTTRGSPGDGVEVPVRGARVHHTLVHGRGGDRTVQGSSPRRSRRWSRSPRRGFSSPDPAYTSPDATTGEDTAPSRVVYQRIWPVAASTAERLPPAEPGVDDALVHDRARTPHRSGGRRPDRIAPVAASTA